MKYPALKCEEKLNVIVCSRDIEEMKKMRKTGSTFLQISKFLKIGIHIVMYHTSTTINNPENKAKRKEYLRKYQKRLYDNNPEFRRKSLDATKKSHARRKNDPNYKKWRYELSSKNFKNYKKREMEKHPNYSSSCIVGSHETTSHLGKCKNMSGKCKCPCHRMNY